MSEKNVLILGLGLSGLAMARWCARQGAHVTVADTRESPPQLDALRGELPQAEFVAGALDASLLQRAAFDAIYRSPGLEPQRFAPLSIAAKQAGVRCAGELDLFLQGLADLRERQAYQPKLIAITGTNGKTTVTALTGRLLERAGRSVAVAGNIGPTLLDTLAQRIDAQDLPDTWVIELSSFQLDGVEGFEPDAAALLNLTQDHLDWHGDMAAYAAAKARVFGAGTHRVLNRDDALVSKLVPPLVKGRVARYTTFGTGMPQRPGDFGIDDVAGMAWLVRALEADETIRRKRNAPQEEPELHIQRLMPADALRVRGRHNAANALAALALAAAVDCPLGPALHALRDYRGEPHRVEPVGILDEVEYFDDSKGTNVGATVAALEGLGAERKLVAILGGEGKGQDFSPLAAPVQRFARGVVLIGRDAALIRSALADTGVELLDADSMEAAVERARTAARPGDAVLLSPACASFDMFDNYPHRGRVFRAAVQALAHDAGVELGMPA